MKKKSESESKNIQKFYFAWIVGIVLNVLLQPKKAAHDKKKGCKSGVDVYVICKVDKKLLFFLFI